jgi:hypothetical protein
MRHKWTNQPLQATAADPSGFSSVGRSLLPRFVDAQFPTAVPELAKQKDRAMNKSPAIVCCLVLLHQWSLDSRGHIPRFWFRRRCGGRNLEGRCESSEGERWKMTCLTMRLQLTDARDFRSAVWCESVITSAPHLAPGGAAPVMRDVGLHDCERCVNPGS